MFNPLTWIFNHILGVEWHIESLYYLITGIHDTYDYFTNLSRLCASIDPQAASFECRVVNSFNWLASLISSGFCACIDKDTLSLSFDCDEYSCLICTLDVICLSMSLAIVWFTLFEPSRRAQKLAGADSVVEESQEIQEVSEWDSDSGIEVDLDTVEEDSGNEADDEEEIAEPEEEVRGRTLTREVDCRRR